MWENATVPLGLETCNVKEPSFFDEALPFSLCTWIDTPWIGFPSLEDTTVPLIDNSPSAPLSLRGV